MISSCFLLAISFLPFFEAKNAAANLLISPPDDGVEVKCERPNLFTTFPCQACNGSGEIMLEEQDFGQMNATRLGRMKKIKHKCAVCNGKKRIEAFMSPVELAMQVAADREKFEASHQNNGDIPVGQAFIPRAKHENLDKKKLKLISKIYGEPCRTCHWTGIEPCKKCDGNGLMDCPNDDCRGGWAVTTFETSYSKRRSGGINTNSRRSYGSSSRSESRKEKKVNVTLCHDCGGANKIRCKECNARRAKPCRKCKGLGTKAASNF